jgi:multidrug efflux pump subunit AcrB
MPSKQSQDKASAKVFRVGMVQLAMRRPITMAVFALSVVLAGIFSLSNMQYDIFPDLGSPSIYVAEPYGGLDATQVESFITYNFESHFFYVTGVEHIESKSIGSLCLIKIQFHPGTNMDRAMAEVIAYASRSRKEMPPGTLPPFVMRFDSGSLPVGDMVFSSKTRSLSEIQNFALNYVRPLFATLPGISAPPPFGSSPRTVVIEVDPKKLREYNLSPEDVAEALGKSNAISPAGNLKIGNTYPVVPLNSIVNDIQELANVPIRVGSYPTVFIRDVGVVKDSTDIQTGYALLNGRRTIYIPVTKQSDASTLTVVQEVKDNMARFQNVLPPDIQVDYQFDQSGYVKASISSLAFEGLMGALLTGLMVLLFLRDWRSALIVIINIPLSLLGAVVGLKIAHQTINIMTLGGLALAVGILVDESTITIENIHVHLARGSSLAKSAINATSEIFSPAFLTMLCILAVFLPAFFMGGMSQALFIPLTLSVGFSVISAFLFSMTLVPVLCTWLLPRGHAHAEAKPGLFKKVQEAHKRLLVAIYKHRGLVLSLYALGALALVLALGSFVGREIFPRVESGELQLRMRAATGTSIDETERDLLKVIDVIKRAAGEANVDSTLAFVGTPPSTYAINTIYLWSSGPQEASLQVALKKDCGISTEALKEKLRSQFKTELPGLDISFEASGLVDKVLNSGSPTPIEISVNGRNLDADRDIAAKVRAALQAIPFVRDLQFGQPFDYPAINVNVNREKAGLQGVRMTDVGKSLIAVTSSTQFVQPNYWEDPKSGINYDVQVEVPEGTVRSIDDLKKVPISINGGALPLSNFADITMTTMVAEYDRYNMQRTASVTANLSSMDLGHATTIIEEALAPIRKALPRGTEMHVKGQIATLAQMTRGLALGLGFAVVVIMLLLAGSFESLPIALIVISNVPAVLSGALLALFLTGSTLNVESFMGTIMAIGVSVANSILLVTFADLTRRAGKESWEAAVYGAESRLRPVLMTSIAMIAGMLPMALGLSESGQQTAPLARAVIGGLAGSTTTTLLLMPVVYAIVHRDKPRHTASLDPLDPHSAHFEESAS